MKVLFILLFLSYTSFTFAQNKNILFTDNFENNNLFWELANKGKISSEITQGDYVMKNAETGFNYRFWREVYLSPYQDFEIETSIKLQRGSENELYGLLWGTEDINNGYYFVISSKGYFSIYGYKQGKYEEFQASKPALEINKSGIYNTLRIKKEGSVSYFYINNIEVLRLKNLWIRGQHVGFYIPPSTEMTADYLSIWGNKASINLAKDLSFPYKKSNMGKNINSTKSEIAPVVSPDGKTLFVARSGATDSKGEYDIYVSTLNPDSTWTPLKNMGSPLNNKGDNVVISVSADGNTLFLEGLYDVKGGFLSDKGISISNRTESGWSVPTKVIINNYYNKDIYESFAFSTDRSALVMSVYRNVTFGVKDMYVSFLQPDGSYSEPKNMGADINTYANEGTPYIAPDNTSLYFYSQGHPGYGSSDIFVSKRLDSTWLSWSKPRNLGSKVNTPDWDVYYTVDAKGDFAYLVSSSKSNGAEDIFQLKLQDNEKPDPVVLLKGRIINAKTGQPIVAEITYENLETGKEIGRSRSNPQTGSYTYILAYGKNYGIRAKAKNFFGVGENIELLNINSYQEITKDLYLSPLEEGADLVLKNVFFEQGRAVLKPSSYPELERLLEILQENTTMQIEIGGHTDNHSSDPALLYQLAAERVKTVTEYLVSKGIAESRITGKAYGPDKPLVSNDTPEGRVQNRRVDFRILKK